VTRWKREQSVCAYLEASIVSTIARARVYNECVARICIDIEGRTRSQMSMQCSMPSDASSGMSVMNVENASGHGREARLVKSTSDHAAS